MRLRVIDIRIAVKTDNDLTFADFAKYLEENLMTTSSIEDVKVTGIQVIHDAPIENESQSNRNAVN